MKKTSHDVCRFSARAVRLRRAIRFAAGLTVVAVLAAGSVLVWAVNEPFPPSLYRPDLKREMTQEQRWKLDFELANEASMKEHNSRRFDAPGSFEKRAQWFEATARWYPIADLMQQMIDFRKSIMRNNEKAFNKLVELGKRGDVGATCMAWMFYKHFDKEVTAKWRYSYEQVARDALKVRDSGHPVCSEIEGSLHLDGDLGYETSKTKARPYMIRRGMAGFYGDQMYLAASHQAGTLRFEPHEFELDLCWTKVADAQSPVAGFASTCEFHKDGVGMNEQLKPVPLPQSLQKIVREWCEPSRIVTAQTCADLEQQYENEKK